MEKIEAMTAEEYRALDADAFEKRRKLIIEASEDGEAMSLEELRSEAALIKDECERRSAIAEMRQLDVAAVAGGAGRVLGGQAAIETRKNEEEKVKEEGVNGVQYRTAFMDYSLRGIRSDEIIQHRADANTLTSDVSAVIPTILVDRIIEKAETYGMILPLVTKTNYPAGIEIPVASLKPVASWVSEGASSDKQKFDAKQKIVFTHFKLRCEVSMSMEVSTMSLSAFENKFVEVVARAMVEAQEKAIINGDGTTQPKGILKETPATGQALTIKSGEGLTYAKLVEAEAAIPQAYEAGAVWFMSKKSFMSFVGMVDTAGQPIARVNYGIGGVPERSLLGRSVVLTGDYLPSFNAKPEADTTFAFIFRPEDYVLNSVYDMGIQKRQDWDTENMQTKAVMACDGKVVDVNSLVTLTVTKASA
jgi:HK97 family phage major capsid protein